MTSRCLLCDREFDCTDDASVCPRCLAEEDRQFAPNPGDFYEHEPRRHSRAAIVERLSLSPQDV